MIRTNFDMGSISKEVMPEDNPVVVNAETESKSESKKFSLSTLEIIIPVITDMPINKTMTNTASSNIFSSSLIFVALTPL